MQIASGTTRLFDPLNGLFGISTEIVEFLENKNYPKRYGYPFFYTVVAIINNFKTLQINNVVEYKDEKSGLSSFRVFFTILKLTILLYFQKLKIKKRIGIFQKSAIFDLFFIIFFNLSILQQYI